MGSLSFGLGKVLIIIALIWILWTIWSPGYLHDSLGLEREVVGSFTDTVGPFKIPVTLIAIGAVLWTGYHTVKAG